MALFLPNLNTRLFSACDTHNVSVINDFSLFSTNSLRLNKAGALVLPADLHCSIHHPRAPLWSSHQLLTDDQSVTD